jgi:hypothetical protein
MMLSKANAMDRCLRRYLRNNILVKCRFSRITSEIGGKKGGLNVTQIRALINSSHNGTSRCTNVKIVFIHTIQQNSRHISIYLDHLEYLTSIQHIQNIDGLLNTLKCVY